MDFSIGTRALFVAHFVILWQNEIIITRIKHKSEGVFEVNENSVSRVICGIGWACIACGVLSGILVGIVTKLWTVPVILCLSAFVSGTIFIGFSEIIDLLQLNAYKTETLIKTVASLNDMSSPSLSACPECGGAISKHASVCVHCGCPVEIVLDAQQKAKAEKEMERQQAVEAALRYASADLVSPEKIDETTIKCPKCFALQKAERDRCFRCGVAFTEKGLDYIKNLAVENIET